MEDKPREMTVEELEAEEMAELPAREALSIVDMGATPFIDPGTGAQLVPEGADPPAESAAEAADNPA